MSATMFSRPQARDVRLQAAARQMFAAADAFEFETALCAAATPLLARPRLPSRALPSVERARQRVDDDPASVLSLGALASEAGASRFQFLRAFAKATGATPRAYVRQARARLARRLIREGWALAEAAIAAGFADQAHMTRTMVDVYAATPGRLQSRSRRLPMGSL